MQSLIVRARLLLLLLLLGLFRLLQDVLFQFLQRPLLALVLLPFLLQFLQSSFVLESQCCLVLLMSELVLQCALHQGDFNKRVFFQLRPQILDLHSGEVYLALVVKFDTQLVKFLKEGAGTALDLFRGVSDLSSDFLVRQALKPVADGSSVDVLLKHVFCATDELVHDLFAQVLFFVVCWGGGCNSAIWLALVHYFIQHATVYALVVFLRTIIICLFGIGIFLAYLLLLRNLLLHLRLQIGNGFFVVRQISSHPQHFQTRFELSLLLEVVHERTRAIRYC